MRRRRAGNSMADNPDVLIIGGGVIGLTSVTPPAANVRWPACPVVINGPAQR
jgi:hypothetical protein